MKLLRNLWKNVTKHLSVSISFKITTVYNNVFLSLQTVRLKHLITKQYTFSYYTFDFLIVTMSVFEN